MYRDNTSCRLMLRWLPKGRICAKFLIFPRMLASKRMG